MEFSSSPSYGMEVSYDDVSLNEESVDVDIPNLSSSSDDTSSCEDESGSKPGQTNKAKSDFFTDRIATCLKSFMCFDNVCGTPTFLSVTVTDYLQDSDFRDADDLDYSSFSAAMKPSNSSSSSTRSTTIIDKLSDTYANGIYSFIPHDKHKPRTINTMQQMVPGDFISEEEEFYASRWNGYLPLAPMSAAESAVHHKSSRRRKSHVARGMVL